MASIVTTVNNTRVIAPQNINNEELGRRYVKQCNTLSIIQLCIGIISVIFAVVIIIVVEALGKSSYNSPDGFVSNIGAGIWCGVFFILTGLIGKSAANTPISSKIVGTIVFCIISSILAFVMMCIEASGASSSKFYQFSFSSDTDTKRAASIIYPMHVILALAASAEIIISITHAGFCCASGVCGACCGGTPASQVGQPVTTTITTTHAPLITQQPVVQPGVTQPMIGHPSNPGTVPYAPQPGYASQPGYGPQPGYAPQPGYTSKQGYFPQPGYTPQPGYVPQPGYTPQLQPGYASQSQPGYAPQPAYNPYPDSGSHPAFDPPPAYSAEAANAPHLPITEKH